MKQIKEVNTGLRLTRAQLAKADQLAQSLRTSRNGLFGMLLDAAQVQAPTVSVGLQKNSRNGVLTTIAAESVAN